MSFDDKAASIRNALRNYTTESVVNLLLKRLHTTNNQYSGLDYTWISCLLLEWALEVRPYDSAREATEYDISVELNRLWKLQVDASNIERTTNIWLTMRTMIVQQARFQDAQTLHMYFLIRLHTILTECSRSPAIIKQFEVWTDVSFNEFFELSIYFISRLMKNADGGTFIPYNEIVRFLCPAYSQKTVQKFLVSVGSNLYGMKESAEERRAKIGKLKPSEFFAEPNLLARPLINAPNGVSSPHSYIASIGISEYVLRSFKASETERNRFRDKFTKAFECYLALILDLKGVAYTSESSIAALYKQYAVEGKKVDFLIEDNGSNVFIDAKGVEPHQLLLLTSNPKVFKDKLADHILKGITQASECARILEKNAYPNLASIESRYALIATHQDFYIIDGKHLTDYLGEEHSASLTEALGDCLEIENVFIASVADFEGILDVCKESQTTIDQFLAYCSKQQSQKATSKFVMRMHIQEYGKLHQLERSSPVGSKAIIDDFEQIHSELVRKMSESQNYWRSIGSHNLEAGIDEFMSNLSNLRKIAY
ncbi:hypothetical protein ACHELR_004113 [Vibrio fluvialis]|nr:hypothetical protein [Vibrio fluvialis]ELI1831812.1 hypothetical protein [Vibrio fluvialis]ELO1776066.1 hypothetical protein [Vibrio fluvialis]ELV8761735.1 hypothetical protein [Vibrio fluvialis]